MPDFAVAPNSIEFAISSQYLGVGLWPMQIKIVASLFEDVCLSRSCTDIEFWNGIVVDTPTEKIFERVVFLKHGVCPRCHRTRADFVRERKYNYKNELILTTGQRAGKSVLASAVIAPYLLHRALLSEPMDSKFGMLENSNFVGTFFSWSIGSARDCLWYPFNERVEKAKCFIDYHKYLEELGKMRDEVYLKKGASLLHYPKHHIYLNCANYRNLAQIRGRTAFFAVVDNGFDSTSIDQDSLRSIEMTLKTVRSDQERKQRKGLFDSQHGMLLLVAADYNGEAHNLYEKARSKSPRNRSLGYRLATWEVNPKTSYDSLQTDFHEIGDKAFRRDFAVEEVK